MYEKSLNEAELILSAQKDSMMLVHKVWEEVAKRSKLRGFEVASLPDFSAMLEGDRRFQIITAQNKNIEEQEVEDIENADTEMEQLGFCSKDRVKLRSSRIINKLVDEDEEEVGSIRRKAFVNQPAKKKKNKIKKKTKSTKKSFKKKKSKKQPTPVKRAKPANRKKSKTRAKGSK